MTPVINQLINDKLIENVKNAIKGAGRKMGVKGKALFMPLRAALTGAVHGPDLATVIKIRGREDVLRALRLGDRDTRGH